MITIIILIIVAYEGGSGCTCPPSLALGASMGGGLIYEMIFYDVWKKNKNKMLKGNLVHPF